MKADVDSILAGINADFVLKTYSSELGQVNDTFQDVQATYAFVMSARYNVTTHKNTSIKLNDTAIEQHEILRDAESEAYKTKRRINQVTNLIDEATILINQTKVCYFPMLSIVLIRIASRIMLSFPIFVLTFCFCGRDIKIRVCVKCQISAGPLLFTENQERFLF